MKKSIWVILAFLCVLSIGFIAGQCTTKKERALNVANLVAARDTIQRYEVKINGLKNFVSLKNAIIQNQKDAIEAGTIEKERLKALHLKELVSNAELQATISILRDSLKLVPGTTIITIKDTAGIYQSYIKIPFTLLDFKEKYLTLLAGMDTSKLAYFDLAVPVSGEMSIGYKKAGFLKTKPVGIFTTKNPYLIVNNMEILIIKEDEKWHQRWWVHALFGAGAIETARLLLIK